QLASRHENLTVPEVCESAIVVDVQVCEHDSPHITRHNTECAQPGTEFLLWLDSKLPLPAHVRMQGTGGVDEMGRLARIHHDHAFRMVDDPCIGGKPLGPVCVGEYPESP